MKVGVRCHDLELEIPFAIARSVTEVRPIFIAEIEHEGLVGYGEASPSAYYGDTALLAQETISGASLEIGDDPFALVAVSRRLAALYPNSPSGRAAVETALLDLVGKITGQPLFKLLGLSGIKPPPTSLTVGVSDVSLATERLSFLRRFPILKAKVGFGDEEALLDLLRRETDAEIRVDANEGWTLDEAVVKVEDYRRKFGIEFFEQPLAKEDSDGYRELRRRTNAFVVVDESVRCKEDVIRWAHLASAVNIKIMKCGGVLEALGMIWAARACGLKVMLGCMVESSVGITAAAHLAPLVDFCDLDGNLLIKNDPFDGVKGYGGVLSLPEEKAGLGVTPAQGT
jgi:L-alanine-DL-glutamate epimerase-like enolase superfamily enzyme